MLYMFVCCPAAVSLPLPLVSPLLCCFVTMAVNVTGAVQLTGGAAFLHLQPAEMQPQAGFVYKALRTTEEIATRIRRGEVVVHPTREPFTKEALNSALASAANTQDRGGRRCLFIGFVFLEQLWVEQFNPQEPIST